MGEIVVDVELENLRDRNLFESGYLAEEEVRRVRIAAVADTGAVMLALPKDVVERLGIEEVGRINTTFADGRRGELPVAGGLTIHIGDRWTIARCIVLPQGSDPLIGQVIMEELDLIADCLNQTLAPRPESPDRPLLRV